MNRKKAIWLAIFTCWPFVYMVIFMGFVFSMMFGEVFARQTTSSSGFPLAFLIILPLHLLTMVEIFTLMAIYIVYLFKTDRVPQDKKALWAVVLFFANVFAMPVFWYLYIWKLRPAHDPGPRRGA